MSYPPGTVFYPPTGGASGVYNGSMASSIMAPAFVPGLSTGPSAPPASTGPHDMIYYLDPSRMVPAGIPPYGVGPPGGVMGMGGMMTPPAFYYPPGPDGMFYGRSQS